jgi:hypothetical protein
MNSDLQGRAACAAEIRKALRRGPSGSVLQKQVKVGNSRLRKNSARRLADQVVSAMVKVGLLPPREEPAGVGQCSINAIRKVHDEGVRFETPDDEWLRKMALPPQSGNSRYDDVTADSGATRGTQRQPVPGPKTSRLGPTHAASVSDGKPLPEDTGVDPTVKALKEIFSKGPQRGL